MVKRRMKNAIEGRKRGSEIKIFIHENHPFQGKHLLIAAASRTNYILVQGHCLQLVWLQVRMGCHLLTVRKISTVVDRFTLWILTSFPLTKHYSDIVIQLLNIHWTYILSILLLCTLALKIEIIHTELWIQPI